jgi:hypothetical protein
MSIATDHVTDYEVTFCIENSLNFVEQTFKFDDMVQRLVRHDGSVVSVSPPVVEVSLNHDDVFRHAFSFRHFSAALEHVRIHVQTLNREIVQASVFQ